MDANEQYARSKYPCLDLSIILVPQILDARYTYDQTSCGIISRVCLAGMKTTDNLLTDSTIQHVSVFRLLGDLWQMFWGGWVVFSKLAANSIGTSQITLSQDALKTLNIFTDWDEALQPNPFTNIGSSFNTVVKGISL